MRIYEITSRTTGEKVFRTGSTALDALNQTSWLLEDCYIMETLPRARTGKHGEAVLYVKLPCKTCPFQYTECKKPKAEVCPAPPTAPDLQDWIKQALQAHLCPFTGVDLPLRDYSLLQKWVRMEEAIAALSPK